MRHLVVWMDGAQPHEAQNMISTSDHNQSKQIIPPNRTNIQTPKSFSSTAHATLRKRTYEYARGIYISIGKSSTITVHKV